VVSALHADRVTSMSDVTRPPQARVLGAPGRIPSLGSDRPRTAAVAGLTGNAPSVLIAAALLAVIAAWEPLRSRSARHGPSVRACSTTSRQAGADRRARDRPLCPLRLAVPWLQAVRRGVALWAAVIGATTAVDGRGPGGHHLEDVGPEDATKWAAGALTVSFSGRSHGLSSPPAWLALPGPASRPGPPCSSCPLSRPRPPRVWAMPFSDHTHTTFEPSATSRARAAIPPPVRLSRPAGSAL
jgi:hypothetical protein